MDDPYKLPLPTTIPHKTMAVHGTPHSALPLPTPLPPCRRRKPRALAKLPPPLPSWPPPSRCCRRASAAVVVFVYIVIVVAVSVAVAVDAFS